MTKMLKAPSPDRLLAVTDPIASRLHRRAGEQGIAYNLSADGRTAEVFRIVKHGDGHYSLPVLGTAQGGDTINTIINAALEFTEHDPELFGLIARDIERRSDSILHALHRLTGISDVIASLSGSMAELRASHV